MNLLHIHLGMILLLSLISSYFFVLVAGNSHGAKQYDFERRELSHRRQSIRVLAKADKQVS